MEGRGDWRSSNFEVFFSFNFFFFWLVEEWNAEEEGYGRWRLWWCGVGVLLINFQFSIQFAPFLFARVKCTSVGTVTDLTD